MLRVCLFCLSLRTAAGDGGGGGGTKPSDEEVSASPRGTKRHSVIRQGVNVTFNRNGCMVFYYVIPCNCKMKTNRNFAMLSPLLLL